MAGRPVTPNLNALAREGTWVREAYSHVGFTTQSGKSIFGGALEPRPGGPSLFRDLKAAGYRIGVFSAAPEDFGGISETVGMRASADLFVDAEVAQGGAGARIRLARLARARRPDRSCASSTGHFRSAADWRRPTFLYLNIQEAHFPYSHPDMPRFLPGRLAKRSEIKAANREMVERTYWNSAAYATGWSGRWSRRLKAQGVYDRTLILVTGDHGEALFEDGFLGHGHVIDRAQTQVPFILSDPALRVAGPVGLADYRGIVLRALSGDARRRRPGRRCSNISARSTGRASIGIVEAGGVWTTLNLETEELWFSDTGRRVRYRTLAAGLGGKGAAPTAWSTNGPGRGGWRGDNWCDNWCQAPISKSLLLLTGGNWCLAPITPIRPPSFHIPGGCRGGRSTGRRRRRGRGR